MYIIKMQRVGSRAQVMHGNARMTGGGLRKKDLKYNKQGKIVSKKMSKLAKKEKRLKKAGYTTRKGQFGAVRIMKGGASVDSGDSGISVATELIRKTKITNNGNKKPSTFNHAALLQRKKIESIEAAERAEREERERMEEITRDANIIIGEIKRIFESNNEVELSQYLENLERKQSEEGYNLKEILKKVLAIGASGKDEKLALVLETLKSKFYGIIQRYIYDDRDNILKEIMNKQKEEIEVCMKNNGFGTNHYTAPFYRYTYESKLEKKKKNVW